MSRLDMAISRLSAQRILLGHAAKVLTDHEGSIIELGLGNGRTYDHLRKLMPERKIYVFDRRIAAHSDTIPPDYLTYLGEMLETLPRAAVELGRVAILIHADIGGGGVDVSAQNAAMIAPLLPPLLQPNALVLADQPLHNEKLMASKMPDAVPEDTYYMYRRLP